MTLGMEVGLCPGHIVLDRNPAPPIWGTSPIFGLCLLWSDGWDGSKCYLIVDTDVSFNPSDTVLDGTQLPTERGTSAPNMVWSLRTQAGSVCNVAVLWKTVGRIKIPFSMQVGLGPDHIVLDGDPAVPRETGHSSPPPTLVVGAKSGD